MQRFLWQTRRIMGHEQMANYYKIETLGEVGFCELSLLAIGQSGFVYQLQGPGSTSPAKNF